MNIEMTKFCRKYQKVLTTNDIKKHRCFDMRKGRRKGKWCSMIVGF